MSLQNNETAPIISVIPQQEIFDRGKLTKCCLEEKNFPRQTLREICPYWFDSTKCN